MNTIRMRIPKLWMALMVAVAVTLQVSSSYVQGSDQSSDFPLSPQETKSYLRYLKDADSQEYRRSVGDASDSRYSKRLSYRELLARTKQGVPRYLTIPDLLDSDLDGIPDVMEDYFEIEDAAEWIGDENGPTMHYSPLVRYLAGQDLGDPMQSAQSWIDDGIPNVWKVAYGFDLLDPTVAIQDDDDDGFENFIEFLLGTDPLGECSDERWDEIEGFLQKSLK